LAGSREHHEKALQLRNLGEYPFSNRRAILNDQDLLKADGAAQGTARR
jgi:hypothetical protein